jgi:hypothetical protein
MRSTHIRRTEDGPDPTLKLVKAWVAFRLVRGDTMAEIMADFRRRFPKQTLDVLYAAQDEAEQQAKIAAKFQKLKATGRDFTLRECLED